MAESAHRARTAARVTSATEAGLATGTRHAEILQRRADQALDAPTRRLSGRALSRASPAPVQAKAAPNRTGLPDRLKAGLETLSGFAVDDVRVHRNSRAPGSVGALAYAHGSNIYLAPGQEHHLPHEAWHVVQQKQGRVRPMAQMKTGLALNDQVELEVEADRMGRRALAVGAEAAGSANRMPPVWDGPILTSLPERAAAASPVVQRVVWKWSQAAQQWQAQGAVGSASKAPSRAGYRDGEEYDDTPYQQRTDPTVMRFLRQGESFMGQRGAAKQLQGIAPQADDIRVDAVKFAGLNRGSGLHEIVPTDLRGAVAKLGNAALIGAQSGARTSTSLQLLKVLAHVGAHTGFSPKPGSRGYTHTKGQKAAHDELRRPARLVKKTDHADDVINTVMLKHLDTTPTGQEIMQSPYLQGMQPNLASIGTIGPASAAPPNAATPDPARLMLSQELHRGRERVKRRVRAHKRSSGRGASPSPPRAEIDSQGGGGDHLANPKIEDEVDVTPNIVGATEDEYAANYTAWLTQAMRLP